MTHIPPRQLFAFVDELSKTAGYGTTMLLGAGLGGGLNYLRHRDEEGAGRAALTGALGGAALTGGGILATKAGRQAALNAVKRERYHLTGGGLGKTPSEQLQKAHEIGLLKAPAKEGLLKRVGRKIGVVKETAKEKLQREATNKQYAADVARFRSGGMSAPGVAKGLATSPLKTLREGWSRGGSVGQVFTGLGALQAAKGFASTPEEGGPGRLERGLSGVGQMVGGMVAPPGLLGGMAVSEGLSRVGRGIGRLGDKATHRNVAPQQAYTESPVGTYE
jgi:hypothetical protein